MGRISYGHSGSADQFFDLEPGELFSLTKRLTVVVLFCQYPLPELVVIHQQQQSLEDVLSLESYIKQV